MELTFLGHSAFLITSGDHRVAIDPFLTDNPTASMKAEDLEVSAIVLTHGHPDHMGDAESIAKKRLATVYAPFEVCSYLGNQLDEANLEPANPGGRVDAPFGFVAFTQAVHSASHDGRYMGVASGIVLNIGGKTIYHAGDTALFSDMKLIGELYKPDVAILPVGDRFTMGPEHAAIAAEWVGAPIAVPCHFGTWPLLRSDISAFTPKGVEVRKLTPGQSFTL
ncbi:MAG: metal-dependent hydrolase [Phycisphaerae bacterium]|nr:metal-dependent hydrolase [Phycisphaerae bacterium]